MVCEGLIAIVREMRANIIRASYSSVIYEMDDFSCALFGPDGQLVAQWWDHPGHVLPLPWGVRCAFEDFKDDIHPGDVLLLNDPYRGGTHLNDVTVIFPVFDDAGQSDDLPGRARALGRRRRHGSGQLFRPVDQHLSGRRAHPADQDLGARQAQPRGDDVADGQHARAGGAPGRSQCLDRCVPDRRERGSASSSGKYGGKRVADCVQIQSRPHRAAPARRGSPAYPTATTTTRTISSSTTTGKLDPVLARLALTVAGDQITADFAGSNVQVPGVVNNSLAVAGAGVFVALKATLDPGGAVNEGAFRPITLKAPEGTIFNVALDAPAGAHGEVRKRAVSVALGALAQIMPEQVSGDLCGSSFPNAIGGWNPRRNRQYVYYEAPAGGNGGLVDADGASAFVNVDFGNLPSIHNVEVDRERDAADG